jgi:hypothetical protein
VAVWLAVWLCDEVDCVITFYRILSSSIVFCRLLSSSITFYRLLSPQIGGRELEGDRMYTIACDHFDLRSNPVLAEYARWV